MKKLKIYWNVKDNLGKTSFTKWKGLRDRWMKKSVASSTEKGEEGTSKDSQAARKDFSGIFKTEKPEVVEIDDEDDDEVVVLSEKKKSVVIPAVLPAKPKIEAPDKVDAKTE